MPERALSGWLDTPRPQSLGAQATGVHLVLQAAAHRAPLRIWAARVGGVEIPNKKMIEFSLQYVYGIGHTTAKAILSETVRAGHVTAKKEGRNTTPYCSESG